jgi:hypothetical protein
MAVQHFYERIQGWSEGITTLYEKVVKRFPSGSRFVEVGSWRGRSAAFMCVEIANSGKKIDLTCVDHWKGSSQDDALTVEAAEKDVYAEFLDNMAPVWGMFYINRNPSTIAAKDFADGSLDFVFLDASHDKDSVEHDILAWWKKLKPSGVMAGHDYEGYAHNWVRQAVHNLFPDEAVRVLETCWIVEKKGTPDPDASKARPRVFLAVPNRPGDSISAKVLSAIWATGNRHKLVKADAPSISLLNYNFNFNWANAMNRRGEIDFFVMLHADVAPEPNWIDTLIAEFNRLDEEHGCDVLSCVIAIKDSRGVSSTGCMWEKDRIIRKISLKQALEMPASFNAETLHADVLMMNTGCWIARMDRDWVEKFKGFRSYDRVYKDTDDGRWKADVIGEDYLWSLDLHKLGVRTWATSKVKILHYGIFDYPNCAPWGDGTAEEVGMVQSPCEEVLA